MALPKGALVTDDLPSAAGTAENTSLSLLDRAKDLDDDAWGSVVQLYGPLVYGWCRDRDISPHDAADVVQDVFVKVSQNLRRFRHDRPGYGFRHWLRTVTKHTTIDHFRRQQKQPCAGGGSISLDKLESLEDRTEQSEVRDSTILGHRAVLLARDAFDERTWQAFWRTVIEEQSPADVADELGVNVCVVYHARSSVLRRLRRDLAGMLD